MSIEVDVPQPENDDYNKLQFATEVACDALINRAIKDGLLPFPVNPHLMYLPDQAVTQQFKDACKAVIDCLKKSEQQPQ